jgi:RNA polymerase sigma-70 factor (ECF subfamily)
MQEQEQGKGWGVEPGSDYELMMRVRDGHTGDLGILFERHHHRLLNYFVRMTGSRTVAEDLVQETFVRILRYRDSYKGTGGGFTTWMFTLARNACTDHLGRASLRDHPSLPEEGPASQDPRTDERLEQSESLGLLRKALIQLPLEMREVIVLRRFHFKKFEEVADILDEPVGTVKARAHRALKQLRRIYDGLAQQGGSP